MKCKICDKKLRSDNSVGFCVKHRNNAPSIIEYKKSHHLVNKESNNARDSEYYYANKSTLDRRICKHCNTEFQPTRTDNEFCNYNCGSASWRLTHKEYIKADQDYRYHNDTNRKLSMCLRSRLNKALKGNIKSERTIELLGCSIEEFKNHLESQFESWMNWNNHGNYDPNRLTWQMDHIMPMSTFDLSDPMQQKDACHYTNLQPLLAKSNLIKGDKYE